MEPSSDILAFREVLTSAKRLVILAGAGLSAGSGISTYRGPGGLWMKQDPQKLATPEAFKQDPSLIWQFYHYRRDTCLKAKPNAAHHALASLSLPSTRMRLLPSLSDSHQPPLFITQNFDSLSPHVLEALTDQLSSEEMQVAWQRLIEMHGSAFRTTCLQCKHVNFTYDTPLAPALSNLSADNFEEKVIPVHELPWCGGPNWNGSNRFGRCGGLLRPGVVWFGEMPEGMGEIAKVLNWTDVLIVVGTSLLVYPAAGFAKTVKERGGKVAVFNLEKSQGDDGIDFLFLGACEETIPKLFDIKNAECKELYE